MRTIHNIDYFLGKRLDPRKWVIPDGYQLHPVSGQLVAASSDHPLLNQVVYYEATLHGRHDAVHGVVRHIDSDGVATIAPYVGAPRYVDVAWLEAHSAPSARQFHTQRNRRQDVRLFGLPRNTQGYFSTKTPAELIAERESKMRDVALRRDMVGGVA